MYLTVFKMTRSSILNSSHTLDIYNSNAVHQLLTGRQDTSRSEGKILYKIIDTGKEIYLYVQTKEPFNREGIESRGLVFVKEMTFDFSNLQGVFEFDVQVFPDKCDNTTGKRYFLKDNIERCKWLQRQFDKGGITLMNCTEYKISDICINKNKSVNVPTASYRGKIYIKDSERAKALFENGLGRCKNYGLGLILIK